MVGISMGGLLVTKYNMDFHKRYENKMGDFPIILVSPAFYIKNPLIKIAKFIGKFIPSIPHIGKFKPNKFDECYQDGTWLSDTIATNGTALENYKNHQVEFMRRKLFFRNLGILNDLSVSVRGELLSLIRSNPIPFIPMTIIISKEDEDIDVKKTLDNLRLTFDCYEFFEGIHELGNDSRTNVSETLAKVIKNEIENN
jgi:alpha-beta hydrolase superfamily lysophospholipase